MSLNSPHLRISVVIPVYNGRDFLSELCQRLSKTLAYMEVDYEVILVDDSSPDDSLSVIRDEASQYKGFRAIGLSKNKGQQVATLVGISYATGDIIITIDDDLQNPPEEIPLLVNPLIIDDNLDVVIAAYDSKKHGLVRNAGTKALDIVSNHIVSKPKDLHLTSFRAMRQHVAKHIIKTHQSSPRIGYLILDTTSRVANVRVHHEPRRSGVSGYNLCGLARDFWRIVSEETRLTSYILCIMQMAMAALWAILLSCTIICSDNSRAILIGLLVLVSALGQFLHCASEMSVTSASDKKSDLHVPVIETVAIRADWRNGTERNKSEY